MVEDAVHAARIALVVDGKLVCAHGVPKVAAQHWVRQWDEPTDADPFDREDGELFPLRMALRCPLGGIRGWLLLGPRPDGSFYGKDDLDALAEIVRPLQRALILVAEREAELARQRRVIANLNRSMARLSERLDRVEQA